MKQIYKATLKKNGKLKDLYFESQTAANSVLNHIVNCITCDKKSCPGHGVTLISTDTVFMIQDFPGDVEKNIAEALISFDNGNLLKKFTDLIDEFIDDSEPFIDLKKKPRFDA